MPVTPENAAPVVAAPGAAPDNQGIPAVTDLQRYLQDQDTGLIILWIEIYLPYLLPNLIIVLYSIPLDYLQS
jgi:hypothetical protein